MKRAFVIVLGLASTVVACQKSASTEQTSITTSSTSVAAGETVTVTASTGANAVSWTVTPPTGVKQTYTITTEKTNFITFTTPGTYTVGVRTGNLPLDSMHHCNPFDSAGHHRPDSIWHQHVDSLWHAGGHHRHGCRNGEDSASVVIHVH